MMEKLKILILDDSELYGNGLARILREHFEEVDVATSVESANHSMTNKRFDCALIDVHLKTVVYGFEVARWYREVDPQMVIIMISDDSPIFSERKEEVADDFVQKHIGIEQLIEVIQKHVWYRQRIKHASRQRIFGQLHHLMAHKQEIRFASRIGDATGAERIDGVTRSDKKPIAFCVYNQTDALKRVIISLASTVGCVGRCNFCASGNRHVERQLSTSEIIAQVLHGLQSYHARRVWEDPSVELAINFTAEGDVVSSNLANGCLAVGLLNVELAGLMPSFIMTTIGHEKNLRTFLEKFFHLPITFYWSVNFLDQKQRERFMPAAASQSLAALRDVFGQISEKTGKTTTAAWMLVKGVNDTTQDIEGLKELFYGRPFEIKVSAIENGSLPGVEQPTPEDLEHFSDHLRKAGLPCRIRKIVGGGIRSGCGTTIPFVDSGFAV